MRSLTRCFASLRNLTGKSHNGGSVQLYGFDDDGSIDIVLEGPTFNLASATLRPEEARRLRDALNEFLYLGIDSTEELG